MAFKPVLPFLETVSLQTAIARGANLSDKLTHTVYQAIRQASTLAAVRNNSLFTLDSFVMDVTNLTRSDLRKIVRRLLADQIIVQIFRLEFMPERRELRLIPCFIGNPQEDHDSLYRLFTEANYHSQVAVETYLESLPQITQEQFRADLETDLNSERTPTADQIPASVVNPFAIVHPGNFDIVPPADMLNHVLDELKGELIRKGRLVDVINYGLMPLRETEVLMRLEEAGDFLIRKVIPRYKNRGNCKRDMEQITLEEAGYRADPFAPETGDFIIRRAATIKKVVLSTPLPGGGIRFPGSLTVESILALETHSAARYRIRERGRLNQTVKDFKSNIQEHGANWLDLIRFVDPKEIRRIPPEAWRNLLDDSELLHCEWEFSEHTIHIFTRRDPGVFRTLVFGMIELPERENWKILAMRSLLEKYENEPGFRDLFRNPQFVAGYGRLLRQAYMRYIPFFHRILFLLGITFFQDRAFQIAKRKIQMEQDVLESINRERALVKEQEIEEEKKLRMQQVVNMGRTNKIVDALDQLYIEKNVIPTVADVRLAVPEIAHQEFNRLLKTGKFQVLSTGREGDPESALLLYPVNFEWRNKAGRIRKVLDRIFAETEGKKLSEPEEKKRAAAKQVQKFLAKADSRTPVEKEKRGDPYALFEKELRKLGKEKVRNAERSDEDSASEAGGVTPDEASEDMPMVADDDASDLADLPDEMITGQGTEKEV